MKPSGRYGGLFIAGVIILHAIFFLLTLDFKRLYMGDSYEYVYMALNIRDHFLFYAGNAVLPLMEKNYTLRPPGYSLFLLLIYVFTVNNWVVLVVQNIISVFNILYLRNTIRLLGYQTRYDWIFFVLLAAYPAQFIYANTIAPDLLVQTCVLIYFRHFIQLGREPAPRHAWIMSIVLTYGVFTKPILYLFVPVHVIIIAWCFYRFRLQKAVFLSLLIPVVSIVSYNTWNLQRTGKFHFTSIQPWNAMYYNVRMFQEHKLGKTATAEFMRNEQHLWDQTKSFKEWYDYGNSRSMEFLWSHVADYMIYHLKYCAQFFIHPGKGEIDLFTGKLTYGRFFAQKDKRITEVLKGMSLTELPEFLKTHGSVVVMFIVLFFNGVKVLGAVLFFAGRRITWYHRGMAFLLLVYFAFMTGPLANTRYHLPVSLIFIGCAVIGYQQCLQRKTNRRIITH